MTNLTLKTRENLIEELAYVMVWNICLAGFIWFVYPAVAEAMVIIPISALVMLALGIMNDVEHGVITEKEWMNRRIM